MSRVSIKQLAEILKISPSTVSFVLNGRAEEMRISEELAKKVKRKAEELNYTPNMNARSLRTHRTKTIGLIVADISNPFFSKLARYVENIAAKRKYQVFFASSDESSQKFSDLCDVFIGKGVDGMIVVPPLDGEKALKNLIKHKMPLVVVDRAVDNLPVNTVMMNNLEAAYLLTNHLIGTGAKKIGLIGHNKGFSNVIARKEGYIKALYKNNYSINTDIIQFVDLENFEENIDRSIDILLNNKVDGIVFATSKAGRRSLYSLKKRKMLGRLKYGSIDLFHECELSDITLFSIEQPLENMCEKALAILFQNIDNPEQDSVETITIYPPNIKELE